MTALVLKLDLVQQQQQFGAGLGAAKNLGSILPAAGVMTTRPVIMPCTAPMTDGLPKKMTSSKVHTRRLMAAQMLVLMTAMEESMLAEYGSPPLNPAHPNHSSPAPVNMSNTLLGGKRSLSFVNLGPTFHSSSIPTTATTTVSEQNCCSAAMRRDSLGDRAAAATASWFQKELGVPSKRR